jgi:hypothetical protein
MAARTKRAAKGSGLRVVGGDDRPAEPVTGEQLMRDAARVTAAYLRRRLREVPEDDPQIPTIQTHVARLALQGRRPQTR